MPHPSELRPGHGEIPGAEERVVRRERRGEPAQIGLLLHPLFLNGIDPQRIQDREEGLRKTPSFVTAVEILGTSLDMLLGEDHAGKPAAYFVKGELLQLIEANHTMQKLEDRDIPKPSIAAGFGISGTITAAMIAEAITFEDAVVLTKAFANGASAFLDRYSELHDTLCVAVNTKASFVKRARQEQALNAIKNDLPIQWKELHLSAVADNYVLFGGTVGELHEITEWIKSYTDIELIARRLGLGLPIQTEKMFPVAASIGYALTKPGILDNPRITLLSSNGEEIKDARGLELEFINGPLYPVRWEKVMQRMQEQGLIQQVKTRADGAVKFVAGMNTPQQVMVGIATATTLAGLGFITRKLRERR